MSVAITSCTASRAEEDDGVNSDTNRSEIHAKEDIIDVKAMKVAFGDFDLELYSNGRCAAAEKADIKIPEGGMISSVIVHDGEQVHKGQVIAVMDQEDLKRKLNKAKDELDKSYIDFKDRLIDYGYLNADSLKVPRDIRAGAKVKSGYNSAMFNYLEAKANLNNSSIKASINGKIANLETKAGNIVDGTTRLCTIVNDENLEVKFDLLESEYQFVRVGSNIDVRTFGDSPPVSGKVIEINPLISESGMIRITGKINNSGSQLLDGMNVKIVIKKTIKDKFFVPKAAVSKRQSRSVIFLLNHNHASWQYVTTGAENTGYIVIENGLKKNQFVITENVLSLVDNSKVNVQN